jgi:hypothetical protein
MEPFHPFRPGDIVLTCSQGFTGAANRLAQFLTAGEAARFTHAAICTVPDVLLDVRPFEHVRLRNVFAEVREGRLFGPNGPTSSMLVLRNPALTSSWDATDRTVISFVAPMLVMLSKKYNWLFLRPQSSDLNPESEDARRAFCSELCVLMLVAADGLPKDVRPSAMLPVDLHALLQGGWKDVTDEWVTELRAIDGAIREPQSQRGRLIMPREERADLYVAETETGHRMMVDLETAVTGMLEAFDALIEKWKAYLPQQIPAL